MKYLIAFFGLINFTLLGQDLVSIDKKIKEIEEYKQYSTVRFDSIDLASVSKDLIESIQYRRKNGGLDKVEIRQKTETGFCLRTYYFNNEDLISIEEKEQKSDITQISTRYYFVNNKFVKALDSAGKDKTNMIDKEELRNRIRNIFGLKTK